MSIEFANIENSGYYADEFREWLYKPTMDKDWANFKTHFSRTFKEVRKSSAWKAQLRSYAENIQAAGFYEENVQAAEANEVLFLDLQKSHSDALSNLANATAADRESVATLTRTITDLTTQVASIIPQLANLSQTIISLSGKTPTTPRDGTMMNKRGTVYHTNGYFWSYGFKVEKNHISKTRWNRRRGHDETTICLNTNKSVE